MPPDASSNLPICCLMAPVNAPFSWPKSVLSIRFSGIAARFTATNGAPGSPACRWMRRASSSLPVPLSPRTSTVAGRLAMRCTRSTISRVTRLAPDHELAVALFGELGAEAQEAAVLVLTFAGAGHQRADGVVARVLRHVVEGAVAHRLDGDGQLLDRRGDDDGDVRVVLLDDLQDVDGADAGQRDVEEHDVHALALGHVDGALAGGGAQHAVVAAQRAAQGVAARLVAVHDEHRFTELGHRREYNAG